MGKSIKGNEQDQLEDLIGIYGEKKIIKYLKKSYKFKKDWILAIKVL